MSDVKNAISVSGLDEILLNTGCTNILSRM